MNKQPRVFVLKVMLVLIVLVCCSVERAGAQSPQNQSAKPKPTIQVDCELDNITEGRGELPETASATVKFSWKALNSDYVFIAGFDDTAHPIQGKISVGFGKS